MAIPERDVLRKGAGVVSVQGVLRYGPVIERERLQSVLTAPEIIEGEAKNVRRGTRNSLFWICSKRRGEDKL